MRAQRLWSGVRAGLRTWRLRRSPSNAEVVPQPVIGLALSGGFARGLAHIGIIKVLEEEGIRIDAVAGTSVGSIIGGAYASGTTAAEMVDIARSIRLRDFARWTVSRMGLATNERMEQMLQRCLKNKTFEDLRIPFAVTTTDLASGDPVIFRSGELAKPIRASCAYPGLFLPITIDGRTLIDGGFSCPVPVTPLVEMGVTHVIAVHLITTRFPSPVPTNVLQLVGQCFSLLQKRTSDEWRRLAHCVIEPPVNGHAWDSFDHASTLISLGEQAARSALPRIRSWYQTPQLTPDLAFSR